MPAVAPGGVRAGGRVLGHAGRPHQPDQGGAEPAVLPDVVRHRDVRGVGLHIAILAGGHPHEVTEEERPDLKVLLNKLFDTQMCALPFNVNKMYHFLLERFMGTPADVQDQNIQWLQVRTLMLSIMQCVSNHLCKITSCNTCKYI